MSERRTSPAQFARPLGAGPWIPLAALTLANIKILYRNRQVLLFNVLVPLLLIVIFGGLFQRGPATVDVVAPPQYYPVLRHALPKSSFHLHQTSAQVARQQVLDNHAAFALVVVAAHGTPVTVRILENSSNVTQNGALTAEAEAAVGALNQTLLHRPPAVEGVLQPVHAPGGLSSDSLANNNYIAFLAPGVLAYAVLAGGLSAGLRLVGDRERGTLRRIRATPAPAWVFLAASVISQFVLVAIQIAVLLGVGHLLYGIGLGPQPLPLLLVLVVGSLCFLAAGFLVAALSRREQAAVVIANLIELPQLFVAGVFYPLSGAPLWLQKLSILMPLTYFSSALRGLMAEGQTLGQVTNDILILLGVGVVVLLAAARTFRFEPSGH
ncbi:MAG: ABC transporter permease [Candidatus Dormibacteria bacterium]